MSRENGRRVATLLALATVVVLVAAWLLPAPVSAINQHWVTTDTFRIYQQGLAQQRVRDSIIAQYKLDRIDTAVQALYRDCQHRRGCP